VQEAADVGGIKPQERKVSHHHNRRPLHRPARPDYQERREQKKVRRREANAAEGFSTSPTWSAQNNEEVRERTRTWGKRISKRTAALSSGLADLRKQTHIPRGEKIIFERRNEKGGEGDPCSGPVRKGANFPYNADQKRNHQKETSNIA